MLVVTHEMGFARSVAQQVLFMDHGRVVESGEPDQPLPGPADRAAPALPLAGALDVARRRSRTPRAVALVDAARPFPLSGRHSPCPPDVSPRARSSGATSRPMRPAGGACARASPMRSRLPPSRPMFPRPNCRFEDSVTCTVPGVTSRIRAVTFSPNESTIRPAVKTKMPVAASEERCCIPARRAASSSAVTASPVLARKVIDRVFLVLISPLPHPTPSVGPRRVTLHGRPDCSPSARRTRLARRRRRGRCFRVHRRQGPDGAAVRTVQRHRTVSVAPKCCVRARADEREPYIGAWQTSSWAFSPSLPVVSCSSPDKPAAALGPPHLGLLRRICFRGRTLR